MEGDYLSTEQVVKPNLRRYECITNCGITFGSFGIYLD